MLFAGLLASAEVSAITPVVPLNAERWIQESDYPDEARRHGQQGKVYYLALVDRNGKVDRCEIENSSSSETLDNATCSLIKERAVFEPARNSEGKPVYFRFHSSITWSLPYQPPVPINSWAYNGQLLISNSGEALKCEEERRGPVPEAAGDFCRFFGKASGAVGLALRGGPGRKSKLVDYELSFTLNEDITHPLYASLEKREIISFTEGYVVIGKTGEIEQCGTTNKRGERAFQIDVCTFFEEQFKPLTDKENNPVVTQINIRLSLTSPTE